MNKTAIYQSPLFLQHETGRDHAESPERLRCLDELINQPEMANLFLFPSFSKASATTIQLNHTKEHVAEVAATARHVAAYLDADTRTSAGSYEAALLASGAVTDGIDRLISGEIDNGFCLVRPPGHHAERDQSMGFCLFNNVAIGARYALKKHKLGRVMIVDWDLHHGNGTQHSFYRQRSVLYCSIHQYPLYPGTGALVEYGEGQGTGYTVNLPLSGCHGDAHYARIFETIIQPVALAYQPQLILVSCGFDCMAGDPLGAMAVSPGGVAFMTQTMVRLASQLCEGKLLFVLEGGYDLDNLRSGTLAVLTALLGAPLPAYHGQALAPFDDHNLRLRAASAEADSASIDQAADFLRHWWPL